MDNTLNRTNYMPYVTVMCIVAAVAIVAACIFDTVFAAGGGTFIGNGASSLLNDFAKVVALAGVAAGAFNIIKGRVAIGIVVVVVAAIVYAFCANDSLFQTVGNGIVRIFF